MEGQSGLSKLSVISWVSAIQGCPLSGVPLYLSTDAPDLYLSTDAPDLYLSTAALDLYIALCLYLKIALYIIC